MTGNRRERGKRETQLTRSLVFFLIATTVMLVSFSWLMFELGGFMRIFGFMTLGFLGLIAWRWTVQLVQLRKGRWGS
ncbi:MAG: hypothetical protein QF652_01520 [Dehalococcoidia bacterium]|jgi:hypothetical protein|nr:hypothetical protein [Dehalococcoidia bacterium]